MNSVLFQDRARERGTVLLGVLLLVLILTLLGIVSLNLGTQEVWQLSMNKSEASARHLAEAGSDMIIQWFHDPRSTPIDIQSIIMKRYDTPESGPSFFDAAGRSQFSGTEIDPDVWYDVSRPADDHRLNDSTTGWFRSLSSLGHIERIKVYGPSRPGLLCSVDVTATAKHLTRTVSVQLGTLTTPALKAAVQLGQGDVALSNGEPFPLWLHWGDLKIRGNVKLGRREDVPLQSSLAAVTGQSYADMTVREDRWLNLWIGGEALFAPTSMETTFLPSNVYSHQEPSPGLHMDMWPYELLKKHALKYGAYYSRGSDGLLYRNGILSPGLGMTVEEVFRSRDVGDQHGLVFVDTMDQQPPRPDNLGTVLIETEYAEGMFVVNAHVQFKPRGAGKSVPTLSSPAERSGRIPVTLTGIHFNGLISTPGDLSYEGQPRLFGALLVEGRIIPPAAPSTPIEVWYNFDFRHGLFPGLPIVYVAPGTCQEKY